MITMPDGRVLTSDEYNAEMLAEKMKDYTPEKFKERVVALATTTYAASPPELGEYQAARDVRDRTTEAGLQQTPGFVWLLELIHAYEHSAPPDDDTLEGLAKRVKRIEKHLGLPPL